MAMGLCVFWSDPHGRFPRLRGLNNGKDETAGAWHTHTHKRGGLYLGTNSRTNAYVYVSTAVRGLLAGEDFGPSTETASAGWCVFRARGIRFDSILPPPGLAHTNAYVSVFTPCGVC
jgi:hypothetical protein